VVGKLLAIETGGVALLDLRKHRTILLVPLPGEPLINVLLAVLQVGAFERVLHDVEEESIVEDLEEFVIAIARRSLGMRLVARQLLRGPRRMPSERRAMAITNSSRSSTILSSSTSWRTRSNAPT